MSLSLCMMMGTPAAVNADRLLQLAEILAPKVGILTSTLLYLAPAKAVWDAIQRAKQNHCQHNKNKKNDDDYENTNDTTRFVSDLNPLPIAMMPSVAVSWFVYGLVSSDPYIIISNCVGSFLSIAYLIGILPLMKYSTTTTTTTNNNKDSGTASSSNNNNSNTNLLFWTHATILLSTATTLGVWAILGCITSSATETVGSPLLSVGSSAMVVQTSGVVVDEVLGMYASLLFILLCGIPLSTIQQVVSTKNSSSILGRFTLAQCFNTTLWSVYGLAVKDRFVYGLLLGFMTSSATETLSLGASSAMVQTSGVVDEVLGMYASLLFILLCGSPLSTIQHVVATKNSSSILGRFTLAQCLNTTLWSVYGLAVKDRFVYGPNIIGLGLGLIQLALKIIFPASRCGRPPSLSSTTSTILVTA
eukprot:CAMPEP_0170906626 /NCGR_PEP_ID=MMETSP0735-20130129/808_1 /TAXON_ID=186038 /ORGANISM="Fragilariopsis kerguelensis, Strain L26-C5" /LENGTH=416 /DNA_ID=CAMNT_0011302567 /DNA_START=15 /DNA_END=1265 /DNA_ORIENTATION=-